jgi:hypothetical protein
MRILGDKRRIFPKPWPLLVNQVINIVLIFTLNY